MSVLTATQCIYISLIFYAVGTTTVDWVDKLDEVWLRSKRTAAVQIMMKPHKVKILRLDPELYGTRDSRFRGEVHHFRGIPYATVSERFAKPSLATNWAENGSRFTEYGAQCPQPAFPLEASMCLPTSGERMAPVNENEFTCCNLNVTCPAIATESRLPVYVWIHGGGQSVSFPSAQHRLGDPGPLVAQSIEMKKPIILVTVNYRLNIFGFSDPEGINMNLDLQDQATAVRWVQEYIDAFGGDPVGPGYP